MGEGTSKTVAVGQRIAAVPLDHVRRVMTAIVVAGRCDWTGRWVFVAIEGRA